MRPYRALTILVSLTAACAPFGKADDTPSTPDASAYAGHGIARSDDAGADASADAVTVHVPRNGGDPVPCPYDNVLRCDGYCCVESGQPRCAGAEILCAGSVVECTRSWDCGIGDVCCLAPRTATTSIGRCKRTCAPEELYMCDPADFLKNNGCPTGTSCTETNIRDLGLIPGFAVCR